MVVGVVWVIEGSCYFIIIVLCVFVDWMLYVSECIYVILFGCIECLDVNL